ncbi:hypothetical protein OAD33_01165 [Alphaproteobacteria bacterium]|nr:hypothetical protein [Alphaproteobacteria bacterium]
MLKNIYIIILILKITLLFSFINPLFAKDKFIIKRDFKPNSYIQFLSFNDFRDIFSNTQNQEDFLRSLNKINSKYFIFVDTKKIGNLNLNEKNNFNKLISELFIEIIKKSKFKQNNYFHILSYFFNSIKDIDTAYRAELELVKLKQSFFFIEKEKEIDPLRFKEFEAHEEYVNFLVDNVRYEVFIKLININVKKEKFRIQIESNPLQN